MESQVSTPSISWPRTLLLSLLAALLSPTTGAEGECPSGVRAPCTCFPTIYEPVNIVCDGAASLAQALTSVGPANGVIDSLTLASVPIARLPAYAFQGYTVKRLVLRGNGLQAIDPLAFEGPLTVSLLELEVRDNALGQIPVTGLPALRSLQTLILAKNGITTIGPSTFEGYASRLSLRKLDLSANRIANVDQYAFAGLTGLQEIGLDKNFLTVIPSAALSRIPSLEGLSLGVNKLKEVPVGALLLPKLRSLSLEVNRIGNLSAEALQGVPNLLYLYLSDNKFRALPGSLFRFVRQLKVLAVGNNPIGDLSGETFTYVPGLVRVEASECGITRLAPGTFQTLPDLQVLVLNKNNIKSVPRNMFQGLGSLVSLDLKSNEIGVVEDRAFSGLQSLKHLDLSDNTVQTLYPATFKGSLQPSKPPTTRVLYIYENPWNCDDRMDWLRKWLNSDPGILIDAPGYPYTMCAKPEWMRRHALKKPNPQKPPNYTPPTPALNEGDTSPETKAKRPPAQNDAGPTTLGPVYTTQPARTTVGSVQQQQKGDTATAGMGGANLAAVILSVILGVLILSVLLLMVVRYFIGKNRRERKEEERWMRDGSSSLSGPYSSPSPPLGPDSLRSRGSGDGYPPPGQGGYFLNRPWYWWF